MWNLTVIEIFIKDVLFLSIVYMYVTNLFQDLSINVMSDWGTDKLVLDEDQEKKDRLNRKTFTGKTITPAPTPHSNA